MGAWSFVEPRLRKQLGIEVYPLITLYSAHIHYLTRWHTEAGRQLVPRQLV